jgi:hypothetical protein
MIMFLCLCSPCALSTGNLIIQQRESAVIGVAALSVAGIAAILKRV